MHTRAELQVCVGQEFKWTNTSSSWLRKKWMQVKCTFVPRKCQKTKYDEDWGNMQEPADGRWMRADHWLWPLIMLQGLNTDVSLLSVKRWSAGNVLETAAFQEMSVDWIAVCVVDYINLHVPRWVNELWHRWTFFFSKINTKKKLGKIAGGGKNGDFHMSYSG